MNPKPVCKHCGCDLHLTSTITGATYWVSNSGNTRCIWPMQYMKHEIVWESQS